MSPFQRFVGVSLAAFVIQTGAASPQDLRWMRGTVVAITENTVTVRASGLDLDITFTVDGSSVLLGGGVRVRPPEQVRPKISEILTIGKAVEVHYPKDAAGNHAAVIRLPTASSPDSGWSMMGRVAAVSRESLTVKARGGEHVFDVLPDTRMIARRPTMRGQKPALPDLLAANNVVLVLYRAEGTKLTADEIEVLRSY